MSDKQQGHANQNTTTRTSDKGSKKNQSNGERAARQTPDSRSIAGIGCFFCPLC